jgi:hypothetical protein
MEVDTFSRANELQPGSAEQAISVGAVAGEHRLIKCQQ